MVLHHKNFQSSGYIQASSRFVALWSATDVNSTLRRYLLDVRHAEYDFRIKCQI